MAIELTEKEAHQQFEAMAGGPQKAFQVMNLYAEAEHRAGGNSFTLKPAKSLDEHFRDLMRQNKFSGEITEFYLKHIIRNQQH